MPNPAYAEAAAGVQFTYESTHLPKGAYTLKTTLEALAEMRAGLTERAKRTEMGRRKATVPLSGMEPPATPFLSRAPAFAEATAGRPNGATRDWGAGKDEEHSKV